MFQNKGLNLIRENRLFKNVNIDSFKLNINHKEIINVKEGESVYSKGSLTEGIFLVLEGQIKVKYSPGNIKKYVKDDFFGEDEIFSNTNRTSTAIADCSTKVYHIKKSILEILINDENLLYNLQSSAGLKISKGSSDFNIDHNTINEIESISNLMESETDNALENLPILEDTSINNPPDSVTISPEITHEEYLELELKKELEEYYKAHPEEKVNFTLENDNNEQTPPVFETPQFTMDEINQNDEALKNDLNEENMELKNEDVHYFKRHDTASSLNNESDLDDESDEALNFWESSSNNDNENGISDKDITAEKKEEAVDGFKDFWNNESEIESGEFKEDNSLDNTNNTIDDDYTESDAVDFWNLSENDSGINADNQNQLKNINENNDDNIDKNKNNEHESNLNGINELSEVEIEEAKNFWNSFGGEDETKIPAIIDIPENTELGIKKEIEIPQHNFPVLKENFEGFLNLINEDLKVPLLKIIDCTTLFKERDFDKPQKYSEFVLRMSYIMKNYINLLNEVYSADIMLDSKVFSLNSLLDEILRIIAEYTEDKNIELLKHFESPDYVKADNEKLYFALYFVVKHLTYLAEPLEQIRIYTYKIEQDLSEIRIGCKIVKGAKIDENDLQFTAAVKIIEAHNGKAEVRYNETLNEVSVFIKIPSVSFE